METRKRELASALRAITAYLKGFTLTPEIVLVRLDGQYGDAVAVTLLMQAGVHLITRARGYRVLEHPHIQRVLAHSPTAYVTQVSTNEAVGLFDGGWLSPSDGMPQVRLIVARHRAPSLGKRIAVGKHIGEWVYEIFLTTLPMDGFLVEDVLDLYHGRGAGDRCVSRGRYRRRSRPLVLVYRVRTRTVADRLPMDLEPPSLARDNSCKRQSSVRSSGLLATRNSASGAFQ